MAKYAEGTAVSVEKSRLEIESTLRRFKADGFYYGAEGNWARIGFKIAGRMIRFTLTLPAKNERRFVYHSRGLRSPDAADAEWEKACRQKWRALALVIKAKLVAVEAGVTSIEEEFLANTLMPGGLTVYEQTKQQIADAYLTGVSPAALLEGPKQ